MDDQSFDVNEAEAQICKYSEAWANVAVTGDPSAMEEIFADDFVGTDSDGRTYTKRQFIDHVRENPAHFQSNDVNEVTVRFFGTVAVAQGNETFIRKDGVSQGFAWTDIYELRGERWEMVAAQDSMVAEMGDAGGGPFSSVRGNEASS